MKISRCFSSMSQNALILHTTTFKPHNLSEQITAVDAIRLYSSSSYETRTQSRTIGTNPNLRPDIKNGTKTKLPVPETIKKSLDFADWTQNKTITEPALSKIGNPSCDKQSQRKDSKKLTPTAPGEPPKTKSEKMRKDVEVYFFKRFFNYVKDKVLEKNFRSAMKIYHVFHEGVREFFYDMKLYLKVVRIVNENGINALTRRELELYLQMPRDMFKVAPAIIGCSLPMVGYAFFPLVFMFPRQFLTTHFWTFQQRAEFQQFYIKERLMCNKPIFRYMQAKLKELQAHPKYVCFEKILDQVGSGLHPSADELVAVKDIFVNGPLDLLNISRKHVRHLAMGNDIGPTLFKRHRLYERAFLVHYMDIAIMREGGPHNLNPESLKRACYLRGLNPENLSNEEMVKWLRSWIKVSTSLQAEHVALFLHLPIMLGYNHPNNWQLIYSKKET